MIDTITGDGTPKSSRGTIQSLERASLLLGAIAAGGDSGASLTYMAYATGLHSSTVFHLIKTLEKLGYVARLGEGKAYFIGPGLFSLAAGAPQFQTLSLLGRPVLDALSAETEEASHLAVRSGDQVLMLAQADAKGMLQISRNMGQVRPIHATAIGKVLLAACAPKELSDIVKGIAYQRFTPTTICGAGAFSAEIDKVACQKYAEDNSEFDENIRCIAVGIPAFAGRIVVAIGISGAVWRMNDSTVAAHLVTLRRHAAELEALLGNANTKASAR